MPDQTPATGQTPSAVVIDGAGVVGIVRERPSPRLYEINSVHQPGQHNPKHQPGPVYVGALHAHVRQQGDILSRSWPGRDEAHIRSLQQ